MKFFLLSLILLLISGNALASRVSFVNSTEHPSAVMFYQVCELENGKELHCRAEESVRFSKKQEMIDKEIAVPDGRVIRVRGIAASFDNADPRYYLSVDRCRVEKNNNNEGGFLKLIELPMLHRNDIHDFRCYGAGGEP